MYLFSYFLEKTRTRTKPNWEWSEIENWVHCICTSIKPEKKRQRLLAEWCFSKVVVQSFALGFVNGDIPTILAEPNMWLSRQHINPVFLLQPLLWMNLMAFSFSSIFNFIHFKKVGVYAWISMQLGLLENIQCLYLLHCFSMALGQKAWENEQQEDNPTGGLVSHHSFFLLSKRKVEDNEGRKTGLRFWIQEGGFI